MKKLSSGFPLILGYLGLFLVFEGIVILCPLITLAFYPGEWQGFLNFLLPSIVAIVLGLTLYFIFGYKKEKGRFKKNEDALLLVLIWVFAILLGALPFYLTNFSFFNFNNENLNLGMTFSESVFESVSGYATVGLTVLPSKAYLSVDEVNKVMLDECLTYGAAHLFLFHRAWLQFIGGIGLILIVTSVISNKNYFRLYFAEGHNDKVVPNLAKSAKIIFLIYTGWVIFGSFALWLSGMTPFDAICHAMCALATGGFGTRALGIYTYSLYSTFNGLYSVSNPIAIETVLIILMLAGATNFLLHTFLLRGKLKEYLKDMEVHMMFLSFIIFSFVASFSITFLYDGGLDGVSEGLDYATSLRYSFFLCATSLSTTGFNNFPEVRSLGEVGVFIGWLLMTVGGNAGSTAGGIKEYRVGLLFKEFGWSIKYRNQSKKTLSPRVIYHLGEEKEVDPNAVNEARNYTVLNLSLFVIGALAMMFFPGVSFEDAFNEFMTGFTGTGLGYMNLYAYRISHPLASYHGILWILSIGMFLGRLEILPAFYAFCRVFVDPIENIIEKKKRAKINREV